MKQTLANRSGFFVLLKAKNGRCCENKPKADTERVSRSDPVHIPPHPTLLLSLTFPKVYIRHITLFSTAPVSSLYHHIAPPSPPPFVCALSTVLLPPHRLSRHITQLFIPLHHTCIYLFPWHSIKEPLFIPSKIKCGFAMSHTEVDKTRLLISG